MKNTNENRISVPEIAKQMGVCPMFVYIGIREGRLPFGSAVKMSGKWTYYINRAEFEKYMKGDLLKSHEN